MSLECVWVSVWCQLWMESYKLIYEIRYDFWIMSLFLEILPPQCLLNKFIILLFKLLFMCDK
jgi:hypothetical protein